MLSSIHPLGERSRNNRFLTTALVYVVGSIAGGTATGLVAGSVGALIPRAPAAWGVLIVGSVAALGLAFEAIKGTRSLPSIPRQVNEDWLTEYRWWVYGGGFGFQLGTGVLTYITTSLIYVMYAAILLRGSPAVGMAIGACFGLVRSVPIFTMGRVDSADSLRAVHRRIQQWAAPASRAAQGTAIAVAAGSIAVAVGG